MSSSSAAALTIITHGQNLKQQISAPAVKLHAAEFVVHGRARNHPGER
ncbi:hypothetical protein ACFY3O_36335 [Streptomyces sp. NPDC001046]